jgi:hypothetical protein
MSGAALTMALFLAGCGESGPPRAPIAGSVTIGGAPLKAGRILFLPQAPTEGPAVSARVVDGKYTLPDAEGPIVGNNRVEVEADLPIGFEFDDEAAFARTKGKLPRQPIPPKFNRESILSIDVKSGEENRFDVTIRATVPATSSASYGRSR